MAASSACLKASKIAKSLPGGLLQKQEASLPEAPGDLGPGASGSVPLLQQVWGWEAARAGALPTCPSCWAAFDNWQEMKLTRTIWGVADQSNPPVAVPPKHMLFLEVLSHSTLCIFHVSLLGS